MPLRKRGGDLRQNGPLQSITPKGTDSRGFPVVGTPSGGRK